MQWRLFIEEYYSPEIYHIPGTHNVVADALSRLEKLDQPFNDSKDMFYSLMLSCTTESYDASLVTDNKLDNAQHHDAQLYYKII